MKLRFVVLMNSAVIYSTKFKPLTTGHFLSFHSRVAVQQVLCTSSYGTKMRINDYHSLAILIIYSHIVTVKVN